MFSPFLCTSLQRCAFHLVSARREAHQHDVEVVVRLDNAQKRRRSGEAVLVGHSEEQTAAPSRLALDALNHGHERTFARNEDERLIAIGRDSGQPSIHEVVVFLVVFDVCHQDLLVATADSEVTFTSIVVILLEFIEPLKLFKAIFSRLVWTSAWLVSAPLIR